MDTYLDFSENIQFISYSTNKKNDIINRSFEFVDISEANDKTEKYKRKCKSRTHERK